MRIYSLSQTGLSNTEIVHALKRENIFISRQTVWRFKRHFQNHQTIAALSRSGRPSKLRQVLGVIESCMQKNDETTGKQLFIILCQNGLDVSVSTILRTRRYLGWSYKGAAYCQMIRSANRQKRLVWANEHINDQFENVIWTDETTVQLESHKQYCCRKK